jgi:hypothetical protein
VRSFVIVRVAGGAFLGLICFAILMLDLRLSIGFLETRATQMGPPVFFGSAVVCFGSGGHRWPARDRHAPGKSSL